MALILDRYTLKYRSEIVEPLLTTVAHGSSLCVVGLAGAGKSNLTRFIAQPEVLRHYLPESIAQEMHVVTVQCHPGTQPTAHFYRALLSELQPVARKVEYSLNIPKDDVTAYDVRETIRHLCETARQRVVIVLDEFESLIKHQPLEFFEELRNIRDAVRTTNRFAFVAITHRLPHRVVGNQRFENSKLFELLRDQIYALGPYQRTDATVMLHTLAARDNLIIDPGHLDRIREAGGGHSRLMYALFEMIKPNFAVPSLRLAALATEQGLVRDACDKLWRHLHSSERAALRQLAAGSLPEPWLLDFLYKRGLITSVQTPYLFAPAFAVYVNAKCS